MRNLLLIASALLLSPQLHAECTVDEPSETVCEAETVVESGTDFADFQTPSINSNDQIGVIAMTEPGSFIYRGLIYPAEGSPVDAFLRVGSEEGSFSNIRVSTLDRFPTLPLSDNGGMYGPIEIFDEFGTGILALGRGGSGGLSVIPGPDTFDAGTFISIDSTTPLVVSPTGTYAFTAQIRADAGATIVGDAVFRGLNSTDVVLQTGMAAPDAGETYLSFLTPVEADLLAINSFQQLALTALVSGDGIDASNDERLIREINNGFETIAREGDSAPDSDGALGAVYANVSNHTFGNVSYSSRGDTVFSARLQETFAPLPYLTGGRSGGGDYDGIFTVTSDGSDYSVMVRGDSAALYFDEQWLSDDGTGNTHFITRLGTPQLNNQGQVAFFANAGQSANSRSTLGLFTYDIDTEGFNRVFQTSGETLEQIVNSADSVDGLSFFSAGNYPNQLAINDMGAVAFTAQVIAGVSSPTQEGLFLYDNGRLDTLALVGASIQTESGLKTISRIEFLSGGTSSGRPSGLSNNTVAAFGLIFDDSSSGVFSSRQQVFVVEDFLWSGSCGSSNWHDGCASTNWQDRVNGENANRLPGSEAMDRVFINGADVLIDAQPVDIFSILASGSLDVQRALTLSGASEIENLMLAADLNISDGLTLSGANGIWHAGDINGAGELLIAGSSTQSGRLVIDFDTTALLNVPVVVGEFGDLSLDGGEVLIGDNGYINVEAGGSLSFTGGLLGRSPTHAELFVVENAGSLTKAGPGTAEIAANYRHNGGMGLISGGVLNFSGITDLTGGFSVDAGATLSFINTDTATFWRDVELGGDGTVAVTSTVAIEAQASADFGEEGALELGDNAELIGGRLNLTGGSIRKVGEGEARISDLSIQARNVEVTAGELTVAGGEFNDAEINIADNATLVLSESGIQVTADSEIAGDGLLALTEDLRLNSMGAEPTVLTLDVATNIENAVLEGRNIGSGFPRGIRSSLEVLNLGDMTAQDLTLDSVILQNGRLPLSLADVTQDTGTFTLPADGTLSVLSGSTFANEVESSADLSGRLSMNRVDGVIPTFTILNSGAMSFDLDPLFPSVEDSRFASVAVQVYNNVTGTITVGASDRAEVFYFENLGRLIVDQPQTASIPADSFFLSLRNDEGGLTEISAEVSGLSILNNGHIRLLQGALLVDSFIRGEGGENDEAMLEIVAPTTFTNVRTSGRSDVQILADTDLVNTSFGSNGTLTINATLEFDESSSLSASEVEMLPGAELTFADVDQLFLNISDRLLLQGEWTLHDAQATFPDFTLAGIASEAEVSLTGEATRFFGLFETPGQLVNEGTLILQDITRVVGTAEIPEQIVNSGSMDLNRGTLLLASSMNNSGFFRLNGGLLQLDGALENEGTLDIGASPGTGTIDGDLVHSGILSIELGGTRPGLDYDQLVVTGTTTIAPGGVIEITLIDPDPTDSIDELFRPRTGDGFEFLLTESLDLGNADLASLISFTNAPSGLRFNVDLLNVGGVFSLMLNAQFGIDDEILSALSGNQAEMAGYLNSLLLGNQLDNDDRLTPISNLAALSTAAFSSAAEQLHPELFSGAPEMLGYQQSFAMQNLFMAQMHARGERDRGLWLGALDSSSRLDGSSSRGTDDVEGDLTGAVFGGDLPLGESGKAFVGAFIGQASADQNLDNISAQQEYDGLTFGVYGGYRAEKAALHGYVSRTSGEMESTRTQSVGGTTARLNGDYDIDSWTGYVGATLPALWNSKQIRMHPTIGLSYVQIEREGFTEQGGPFALDVLSDQYEGLFSELGMLVSGGTAAWQPRVQLGWRYNLDYNTDRARARLAGISGAVVSVRGARTPRSMAFLGVGLHTALGSGRFFIEYQGNYASGFTDHAGNIGVYFPL
ncbi:MAG: autotransporter outer membrane beta-barrel domain-containing protein [Pseudomonadaceae bacterium]|nr:autotransporter outer membrane beta-barrel domain-containing protein [Pseudomonadaceae bacterium]